MKKRTLSQLDRVECLFWRVSIEEIKPRFTGDNKKPSFIVLPSLQDPKNMDQVFFWERLLRDYGQKLLYIQDLGRLQKVAAESTILKELPIHDGILLVENEPEAYDLANIQRIDPVFLKGILGASPNIVNYPRGDSSTYVFKK